VRIVAAFSLLALVACFLSAPPEAKATTFSPTANVSLANPAAGANSALTATLTLNSPDAMFQNLTLFVPPEFVLNTGNLVPDGAVVGEMSADVTLGLINSACNTGIPVQWDLLDASTNINDTVSFEDTDGDFNDDYADDADGDGLLDGITKYPEPLTRILPGVTPRQRIAGLTPIAGIPYLLSILILEPGTPLPGYTPAASLGYPAVVVINDEGDPESVPEPGAVTDTCTTLELQADLYGVTQNNPDTTANESGVVYRTNPSSSGVYPFAMVMVSQPDADDDGHENRLDTCPFAQNAGSPRINANGDSDFDGLDAACDPNDVPNTGGTNSDQDSDGYLNRHDNCPIVSNGQDTTNQADADLDGIGDVCDTTPSVVSGHMHTACLVDEVTVGAGGPAPPPPVLPCGDTDLDGDGVPDSGDNCPTVSNAAGQAADSDGDMAGDACDGQGSGNVDCSADPNAVSAVDSLKILRFNASLSVTQNEPCLDIGFSRLLTPPANWMMGDGDCSGGVSSVDALKILRANAGLSVTYVGAGCPQVKP
jgi:hypothetical protein